MSEKSFFFKRNYTYQEKNRILIRQIHVPLAAGGHEFALYICVNLYYVPQLPT